LGIFFILFFQYCLFIVAIKNIAIKRELKIIKFDVVKNQELLINLTEKAATAITVSDTAPINKINLKIPIQILDDLNTIETDEEKMDAFVYCNFLLLWYVV